MKFTAEINVMPLQELLDPQGKAVAKNMKNLGLETIEEVRIGKRIVLTLEAEDETAAQEMVDTACKKLLANLIMESYHFVVHPLV